MTQPLSPKDLEGKEPPLPDEVIEVFNVCIRNNYRNGESVVKSKEVDVAIAGRLGVSLQVVYDKHYMDVEEIYRKKGWGVVYEQPHYSDPPFDAFFRFSAPRKKGRA